MLGGVGSWPLAPEMDELFDALGGHRRWSWASVRASPTVGFEGFGRLLDAAVVDGVHPGGDSAGPC